MAVARRTLIVTLLLILTSASIPVVGIGATQVDSERLRAELRFRYDFGFRSDEAFVRQLVAANPENAGPILTPAEQAEFDRRVTMQDEMTGLEQVAESMPGFAGHWIDQRAGGVITVAFNGGAEARLSQLQASVPRDATVRVVNVPYTLDELHDLAARIQNDYEKLASDGIELGHWGVDISENRVQVGVIGLGSQATDKLRAEYGDRVILVPANPAVEGCTSREACFGPPLRAGVSGAPANVVLHDRCSIAFLIHYSSFTQWLTAGHCAKTEAAGRGCSGFPNWCWYQGANSAWGIGKIMKTCWPGCLHSDAARAGNINATFASYVVYKTPSTTRAVSGSQAKDADDDGDVSCLNARYVTATTGFNCGTLDHIGTINYGGGVWFEGMRFAWYQSQYGDSGGAVHSYATLSNPVVAFGVQSGCTQFSGDTCIGMGVYSHIYWILSELGGASICSSANPCP